MPSDLFQLNRKKLKAVFEKHALRNQITITELFKICNSIRVFPDLLNSSEIRTLVMRLTASSHLSFEQFEKVTKMIARKCFPSSNLESYRMFFMHVRNSCHIRYGIELEVQFRSNSKKIKTTETPKRKLNLSETKKREFTLQKEAFSKTPYKRQYSNQAKKLPFSRNNSFKFLRQNSNSTLDKEPLTERKMNHSQNTAVKPFRSPTKLSQFEKAKNLFYQFKESNNFILKNNHPNLNNLLTLSENFKNSRLSLKFALQVWRLKSKVYTKCSS